MMKKYKVPITDSISELAAFFQTHDSTEIEFEEEDVPRPDFAKYAELKLQLKAEEAYALAKLAHARKLTPEELVLRWIQEKMAMSPKSKPALRNGSAKRR